MQEAKKETEYALAGKARAEKVSEVLRQRLSDVTLSKTLTQEEDGLDGDQNSPGNDTSRPRARTVTKLRDSQAGIMSKEELEDKKRQIREAVEAEKKRVKAKAERNASPTRDSDHLSKPDFDKLNSISSTESKLVPLNSN